MKTKIYAGIVLVLLSIVAFTFIDKAKTERDNKREKTFKVENFDKVSKIVLTDRETNAVHLEKTSDGWMVNNKYPIRKHLLSELKEALTQIEAVKPVSLVAKEGVGKRMISSAIKVEIFKGKDKASKTIYVGGPNFSNTATHMFLEYDGKASKNIYEVTIPGFRGYITSRFVVNETEWRSKEIFDYSPKDVSSFDIKYFKNHGFDDFKVSQTNNNYTIEIEDKVIAESELNQAALVNYLALFENQQVMAFYSEKNKDKSIKDSLLQVNKYAEIELIDAQNVKHNYLIVDMPLNESSNLQYDENGDPMKYDIDMKFIIYGEDKDWGIISNSRFGLLYASPQKFLK